MIELFPKAYIKEVKDGGFYVEVWHRNIKDPEFLDCLQGLKELGVSLVDMNSKMN